MQHAWSYVLIPTQNGCVTLAASIASQFPLAAQKLCLSVSEYYILNVLPLPPLDSVIWEISGFPLKSSPYFYIYFGLSFHVV